MAADIIALQNGLGGQISAVLANSMVKIPKASLAIAADVKAFQVNPSLTSQAVLPRSVIQPISFTNGLVGQIQQFNEKFSSVQNLMA